MPLASDPLLAVTVSAVIAWVVLNERVSRAQNRSAGAMASLIAALDRTDADPDALMEINEQAIQPGDRLPDEPLTRLEREIGRLASQPEAAARILLANALLVQQRHDWTEYRSRLAALAERFPAEARVRMLLSEADELAVSQGASHAAPATAEPLDKGLTDTNLMMTFESLGGGQGTKADDGSGGGCEFGLVHRRYGAEPLNLLRGLPSSLLIFSAPLTRISCNSIKMTWSSCERTPILIFALRSKRHYGSQAQEKYYRMQIDHTHLDRSKVGIDAAGRMMRTRFRFLEQKLLGDLGSGQNIPVYRLADDLIPMK